MEAKMKSARVLLPFLILLTGGGAIAAQPYEGRWAIKQSFCAADLARAVNNTDFPLIVTEDQVDWALNRCTVLKRTGRTGNWQMKARCTATDGTIKQNDFSLRVNKDRLTVTFADGTRARYLRCKEA
jgi:hypothetical protein